MSDEAKTPAAEALAAVLRSAAEPHRKLGRFSGAAQDHHNYAETALMVAAQYLIESPAAVTALLAACRAVDPEVARLKAEVEAARADRAAADAAFTDAVDSAADARAAESTAYQRGWVDGRDAATDNLRAMARFESISGHATLAAACNALAHMTPPAPESAKEPA